MATATKAELVTIECPKCCGRKHMEEVAHVANGVCFRCGGAGVAEVKIGSTEAIDAERIKRFADEDARRLAWLRSATEADIRRMNDHQLHAAHQFVAVGVSCSNPTAENLAIYRKVRRVYESRV